ncbi:MAG: OmpA family protein [Legionella sp.]|nr:OmpA family protein [Legionella sp.]
MITKTFKQLALILFTITCLSSCFQPPFNHFKADKFDLGDSDVCGKPTFHTRAERNTIARTTIRHLASQAIQFVQQGDKMTLIIPTDPYYLFNSPDFDDTEFAALNNIAKFVKLFPCSQFIVAGFTDNVGKKSLQNKLSKARAETMLTFLWAKGVPAQRLKSEGLGQHFSIGNNRIVHGSAYNRRIEIQWWTNKVTRPLPIPENMKTK